MGCIITASAGNDASFFSSPLYNERKNARIKKGKVATAKHSRACLQDASNNSFERKAYA
jgi:hypothetical protein